MWIFLDANVLFSAGKSNGAMRRLLMLLRSGGHELVADDYVTAEARRNIEAKFSEALADFEQVAGVIHKIHSASRAFPYGLAPDLPEKDLPVLAAAIAQRCDILMTGDKTHFGRFYGQTVGGVKIVSPAGVARMLVAEE